VEGHIFRLHLYFEDVKDRRINEFEANDEELDFFSTGIYRNHFGRAFAIPSRFLPAPPSPREVEDEAGDKATTGPTTRRTCPSISCEEQVWASVSLGPLSLPKREDQNSADGPGGRGSFGGVAGGASPAGNSYHSYHSYHSDCNSRGPTARAPPRLAPLETPATNTRVSTTTIYSLRPTR
jgi:hypothetical protein